MIGVAEPAFFQGVLLVLVPHMDDEALACGALIARLPHKERLHLVYATDGRGSPAPPLPWLGQVDRDLNQARTAEARRAMGFLGVPVENLHFLDLPDGRLRQHQGKLSREVLACIERLRPDHILIPFRCDRHPDHLALNRVVTDAFRRGEIGGRLTEYFVYTHWRLLPEKDIRRYIRPDDLLAFDPAVDGAGEKKRGALELFTSQTTRFFDWQTRPNLTPELLDEVSQAPEYFLPYRPEREGTAVFTRLVPWILVAHRLEPFLKQLKDRMVAIVRRGVAR